MSAIAIPRKGGPLDGTSYKCSESVYQNLEEGQFFGSFIRDTSCLFAHCMGFFVKEVIYRLQKNSDGGWELVYVRLEKLS